MFKHRLKKYVVLLSMYVLTKRWIFQFLLSKLHNYKSIVRISLREILSYSYKNTITFKMGQRVQQI